MSKSYDVEKERDKINMELVKACVEEDGAVVTHVELKKYKALGNKKLYVHIELPMGEDEDE